MRFVKLLLVRLLVSSVMLFVIAACAAPTPATTPVAVIANSATPALTFTATPAPTETATATATATTTSTSTPTATATATPRPSATPQPAVSAPAGWSPPVENFTTDGFRGSVKDAHGTIQYLLSNLGRVISGGGNGSCRSFKAQRDVLINYPVYANPPANFEGLHAEYRAVINEAVKGVDPVFNACSGGGGTIDTATFQQMLNVLEACQNRMYAVRKQLEGIP